MSLDTAISYIGTLLGNIADIKYVTSDPPEASAEYPFATIMPSNGSYVGEPGLVYRGRHEIVATVHFNRSNLPLAYSLIPGVVTSMADEFRADPSLNSTVDTIISTEGNPVRYNVRFVEYAGVPTLALEMFLTVKIHEIGFLPSSLDSVVLLLNGDGTLRQTFGGAVSGDGDPVGQWVDSSSLDVDILQTTTSAKPTKRLSVVNTHHAVEFDGGDYLQGIVDLSTTTFTIYAVVNPDAVSNNTILRTGALTGGLQWRFTSNVMQLLTSGGASVGSSNTAVSTGVYSILVMQYDGTNYSFRLNGAADGSGSNAQTFTADNEIIIGARSSGTSTFDGHIAYLLMAHAEHALTDIQQFESWASSRFGVSI